MNCIHDFLSTIISNRHELLLLSHQESYTHTNTLIDAAIDWFLFQFNLTTCSFSSVCSVYVSYRLAGAIFIAAYYIYVYRAHALNVEFFHAIIIDRRRQLFSNSWKFNEFESYIKCPQETQQLSVILTHYAMLCLSLCFYYYCCYYSTVVVCVVRIVVHCILFFLLLLLLIFNECNFRFMSDIYLIFHFEFMQCIHNVWLNGRT